MMRLLLDQGLPRGAVEFLSRAGIVCEHVGDVGLARATDPEIIEYARQNGFVVVTLDADFHAHLALADANGPSVVRIRIEGLKAEAIADLVVDIITRCHDDLVSGALVSAANDGIRVHLLPVTRRFREV